RRADGRDRPGAVRARLLDHGRDRLHGSFDRLGLKAAVLVASLAQARDLGAVDAGRPAAAGSALTYRSAEHTSPPPPPTRAPLPPRSTLFPYTTLFRSRRADGRDRPGAVRARLLDHGRDRLHGSFDRLGLKAAVLVASLAQARDLGAVDDGRPAAVGSALTY